MPNPWDNDPIVGTVGGPPGPVTVGTPRPPAPPSGFKPSDGGLTYIPGGPADPNAPGNSQANQKFDNITSLRKQFEGEQPIQDYKTILPLMDSAFKLGPNKAGDLNLVYAFGKVMDPGSVVREGEQVMATNVGGVSEKVQGYLAQINGGAGLTPVQRTELTEEIRHRAHSLAETYAQRRSFYEGLAKRNGINPEDVVGPNPFQPFAAGEAGYIEAHGGTPKIGGVPIDSEAPTKTIGGFDGELPRNDPTPPHAEDFRNGMYSAMRQGQIKSPSELAAWVDAFNQQNQTNFHPELTAKETARAIVAARQGRAFNIELPKYAPDISDMRGGGGLGEKLDAGVRGAADTASFGLSDKAAALGDTVARGGTFDENLARQYAISDYDTEKHFPSRLAGQVAGGFAVPMGRVGSLAELAAKGSAVGAGYGLGSSRSLEDVPGNVVLGGVAGAAIPVVLGAPGALRAATRSGSRSLVDLVDATTGTLNEPLEAAGPAARVAAAKDMGIDLPYGSAGDRTAAIIEKKLDVRPASAGVMNDARRVVEGQVQGAAENVASKFGSSRTLSEGGAELQRGVNEYIERGKTVAKTAYDAIPISDASPTSLANTRAALNDVSAQFDSNPALAAAMRSAKIDQYAKALHAGDLSWRDLKAFRSKIGEAIGDRRLNDDSATSDLRKLYASLSEDMRDTAAAAGPQASRAFDRANTLYRNQQQMIDGALTRILGKDGQLAPEKAAAAVQAMTKGGKSTGDLKTLSQVRAATIKSGAWDEIAGTLIRIGGKPADSPGRGFDPGTFVRWYSDMSEPARAMLFKPELRKSLDQFVMVNQRLANSNALRNTSNTAMGMPSGMFGVPSAVALGASGHPVMAAGLLAGTAVKAGAEYGMANLWTSPKFVQWATGYSRAAASGGPAAVSSQIGRLKKLATTNPELRDGVEHLLRMIANDNAPRAAAVASPEQGPDNSAQAQ